MCSFRLGLLSAGLAVWVLLTDVSVSVIEVSVASAESQSTPITSVDRLLTAQKQIVLRTEAGEPVQDVTVLLAPADSTAGGPEQGSSAKSATTGADGTATFTGLGQWIWMVSFSGTFRGKAIQAATEQGRASYGRTRSGGGFPVMVERQEEDTPATPVVVQGTPQPDVQPSLFVLLQDGDNWVPAIDLALSGEHPQPLGGKGSMAAQAATATSSATQISAAISGASGGPDRTAGALSVAGNNLDSLVRWLYLLPVAVALLALYRAWQERKQDRQHKQYEELDSTSTRKMMEDER